MSNILLLEPNYKNKYPPLGLMKISTFHKHLLGDYIRFAKGSLPNAFSETKWDKVYVTSLFTYEWKATIEAIKYALSLVDSPSKIIVGGIAATLMPNEIYNETGVKPVCGLLNTKGKLGIKKDECIDQLVPDYEMLDDIKTQYTYPNHDAYFLSATKGCGMRCGFCAVQTLEPSYVPYQDIKAVVRAIDQKYGQKKDLLLMDNNVLRSSKFNQIIDDILELGFCKGATYINPKTGKYVNRYVDFNQGLDANFLTEEKAKRLGEIALRPARIAFDHIEDNERYEEALRLCAMNGVEELSNYVLYNSEDFSGKGQKYKADSPEDLYTRMRITLDLKEKMNQQLPDDKKVSIFSFPMRYIPLSATERGYVGSKWNAKFLRAVQCMLIPTQGKGVGSRSFFEADFGGNESDFVKYLCMPERLIAARGKFIIGGRGRANETDSEVAIRKEKWTQNQKRLDEWNRLFKLLRDEKREFVDAISDNVFLPEKLLGLRTSLQKKLYLHYLTETRMLELFSLMKNNSPTKDTIYSYIIDEFPILYTLLIDYLSSTEAQRVSSVKLFYGFFGKEGIVSLLERMSKNNYSGDKQLTVWAKAFSDSSLPIDFELIRLYRRFVDIGVLSVDMQNEAKNSIMALDMTGLSQILLHHFEVFKEEVDNLLSGESGEKLLLDTTSLIYRYLQTKLTNYFGDNHE